MNIWSVQVDVENYSWPFLVDEAGVAQDFWPRMPEFDGRQLEANDFWSGTSDEDRLFIEFADGEAVGDFSYIHPGALLCNDRALKAIATRIENDVQVIPMGMCDGAINLLNVIRVIDCLDEEESSVTYFDGGQDVMSIENFIFVTSLLRNHCIFKIPQLPRSEIFVTDAFRDRIVESGITGLRFDLVYSDK